MEHLERVVPGYVAGFGNVFSDYVAGSTGYFYSIFGSTVSSSRGGCCGLRSELHEQSQYA